MPEPRTKVFEAASGFNPAAVVNDIVAGALAYPVWLSFAWDEMKQRYRRSALGLAWILVSYILFVVAIVIFFGGFSSASQQNFIVYVAIGYAAFTFLSGNIVDGCEVFVVSAPWVKSTTLPYSVHVFRSVARSILPFAIQLACSIALLVYFRFDPSMGMLLLPAIVIIYVINAVALQFSLGLIAARYRDVSHLTNAINRLMFFATPIMWTFGEAPDLVQTIAKWNPMTHFIDILRAPLMGIAPDPSAWPAVALITAINWTVAIIIAGFAKRRLPFWV